MKMLDGRFFYARVVSELLILKHFCWHLIQPDHCFLSLLSRNYTSWNQRVFAKYSSSGLCFSSLHWCPMSVWQHSTSFQIPTWLLNIMNKCKMILTIWNTTKLVMNSENIIHLVWMPLLHALTQRQNSITLLHFYFYLLHFIWQNFLCFVQNMSQLACAKELL